jgi:beta-glucosidase
MSARMTATYQPSESGRHYLSLSGAGVTRLYVDGTLVASQEAAIPDAMAFIAGCQDEVRGRHDFEAGKTYKVEDITTMPDVRISDSPILDKQLCAHVGFVPQR